MGLNIETAVESTQQVLNILGCENSEGYQKEFWQILDKSQDLHIEDWSCEPEMLAVLYCITRCNQPHTVVEIGTYKGKSALIFAEALNRNGHTWGSIYTIDNDLTGTLLEAKERFSESDANGRIHLLETSSQNAFGEWKRAKIDLLFIDGAHSYLNACCDFALWCRHLSPNGMIIMHDTVTRLERCFPRDYIFPLEYYDVLNITDMIKRPSGHEWEGAGFITRAGRLPNILLEQFSK